jgi:protein phosphatase
VTVIIADVTDADIIESQPIVGGAASRDRGMATAADPASPAARAAMAARSPEQGLLNQPRYDADYEDDEPDAVARSRRRGGGVLLTLIALVALGLLSAGLWYGWQNAYYVGTTGDDFVAIYHGFRGEFGGMRLSTEETRSDTIRMRDLSRPARVRVEQGILADNRDDAYRIFSNITKDSPQNENLLQPCVSNPPSLPPTTPPASKPGGKPNGTVTPTPRTSASSPDEVVPTLSPTPEPQIPGDNCRETD